MSQLPLVVTKLLIPPLRPTKAIVPRPQLWQILNASERSRLILISASAGSGKTTTISEWVHQQRIRAAWFSLDEADNESTRFWQYFFAACQSVWPEVGKSVETFLQGGLAPVLEALLACLINDLAARTETLYIVLDDYHFITEAAIHQALAYLINCLPPNTHLVLLTRADPPLPLASLRAHGELTELRAAQLHFSQAEASIFINQVMSLDMQNEDVATLESRTEGWIAGLQLAALAIQSEAPEIRHSFVQAFAGSHRHVVDYLVEEVFQRQPAKVQTFLLQTSILNWLSGPLCDAVTGQDHGEQMLIQIERANLFVQSLAPDGQRYRYHHLFAELLRLRLKSTCAAADIHILHIRAAHWLEAQGYFLEAMQQALSVKDYALFARSLWQVARPALKSGEISSVRKWLEAIPESECRANLALADLYTWVALLSGSIERVDSWLQVIENHLVGEVPTELSYPIHADILTMRTLLAAYRGDFAATIRLGKAALAEIPSDDLTERSIVALLLSDAFRWDGDLVTAWHFYEQVAVDSAQAKNYNVLLQAQRSLGSIAFKLGRLQQAGKIFDQALALFPNAHAAQSLPAMGAIFVGRSMLAYEYNLLDIAMQEWEASKSCCEELTQTAVMVDVQLISARLYGAQGDWHTAQNLLDSLNNGLSRNVHPYSWIVIDRFQVHLWASTYQTEALTQWLEASAIPDYLLRYGKFSVQHTRARALIALGQQDTVCAQQAEELLASLYAEASARGWQRDVLEITLLQAQTWYILGKSQKARSALDAALLIGEAGGYVRTFVDEGDVTYQLLRECRPKNLYTKKLLAAFGNERLPTPEQQSGVEPLSERERVVLQLIAAGDTNQEIAGKMIVAVSTVKTHINHIFAKLGVRTRAQAIARGREAGILS